MSSTTPVNATKSTKAKRLPPQNLEAETAVIGGVLIDPESVHAVLPVVRSADFYTQAHQLIFSSMIALAESNRPIDLLTVTEELRKRGNLQTAGGAGYLSQLVDDVHTSANIVNYARIVREKSTLRELIHKASSVVEEAFQESDHIEEFLDRVEKMIFEISEKRASTALSPIADVVHEGMQAIEKMYGSKSNVSGQPSGFYDLDKMLSGLQPADLIIIAGRPSMGKTAFALNLVQNVAIRTGLPTAIFSLEMSRAQLAMRMLCSEGRIDSSKLRTGQLSEEDWLRLTNAAGELAESPVYIDDTPQATVLEIRAKARRLKARHGLGLVVVDYLQLMQSHGRAESREREISEISRGLKGMAKELDVPVMALSQLNRGVEARQDKRPMMVDLRESGAIEQDADVIGFIYRDEVYNPETPDQGIAEIIIGKHRNGPTGTVRLAFLNSYTRFENLEYSDTSSP